MYGLFDTRLTMEIAVSFASEPLFVKKVLVRDLFGLSSASLAS